MQVYPSGQNKTEIASFTWEAKKNLFISRNLIWMVSLVRDQETVFVAIHGKLEDHCVTYA